MLNWTFHTWIGTIFTFAFGFFLIGRRLRNKIKWLNSLFTKLESWFNSVFSDKRKKIFIIILILVSAGIFIRCYICESNKTLFEKNYMNLVYFHLFFRYFIRTFPMIVAGAMLGGIIEKYFGYGKRKLPSSMLGAGFVASVIPICSCSVIPIAHSLLLTKKMPLRTVITFLIVAPVLNPYVIFLGTSIIGWKYTFFRIVSIFLLGMTTGILMEKFIRIKEQGPLGIKYYSCQGCSKFKKEIHNNPNPSALLSTYNILSELLVYVIIGIAIGSAVAKYLPPKVVGNYLSSNTLGLFLATIVGIPLFICSGEEILILKPLLHFGLPLGHAITFTIAGNGICFASIPILLPCFGKKATIFILSSFFIGSFLIGLLINILL